jgi:hypothetical protein
MQADLQISPNAYNLWQETSKKLNTYKLQIIAFIHSNFARSSVQTSARRLAILNEVFHDLPQSLHAKEYLKLGRYCFLPYPLQFIIQ